jgi:hypothetical protein
MQEFTIERTFQNKGTESKFTSKSNSLLDKDNIERLTNFSNDNMKRNTQYKHQI